MKDMDLGPFTHCPECGGTEFLEGPHGGVAVNFCCAGCWARFNDPLGALERDDFPELPAAFQIQRDGYVLEPERSFFHRGAYRPVAWAPKPETHFPNEKHK